MDRAKEERLVNKLKDPDEKNSSPISRLIDNTMKNKHKVYLMTDWHLWVRKEKNKPDCHRRDVFDEILKNVNDTLDKEDLLIFLGDLVDGEFQNKEELKAVLLTLAGRKIMVRGNNDLFPPSFYKSCGFEYVVDSFVWHNILFTHMPVENDNDMNIHGHIHSDKYKPVYWIPYTNQIDVANIGGRVKPIELNEVIKAQPAFSKKITVDENHLDGKYKVKVEYASIFGECMALAERIEDPFPD
jgi:calcineurin-like phosphoesterase family protein